MKIPSPLIAKSARYFCVPVSHGEGRYVAAPEVIAELETAGRVAFRYVEADGAPVIESPNGSINDIAES